MPSPPASTLLDAQLCPIYAIVAAQDLLAISLNQSRGRPLGDHLLESNGLIPILRRSIETGEAFADRELVLNLKSTPREPRIVDVTITPLEGEVTGTHLLLELTDTTARQRISRENDMLVRLDSSRMAVLRQLAHDRKNLLGAGLRGAAQLLERELPNENLKEYTAVIISEADRLSALVASMTGPNRPLQKTQLNIHELCRARLSPAAGRGPCRAWRSTATLRPEPLPSAQFRSQPADPGTAERGAQCDAGRGRPRAYYFPHLVPSRTSVSRDAGIAWPQGCRWRMMDRACPRRCGPAFSIPWSRADPRAPGLDWPLPRIS